ncbi:hypothetical protein GCM10020220_004880 [Nonomuraea rubra]
MACLRVARFIMATDDRESRAVSHAASNRLDMLVRSACPVLRAWAAGEDAAVHDAHLPGRGIPSSGRAAPFGSAVASALSARVPEVKKFVQGLGECD